MNPHPLWIPFALVLGAAAGSTITASLMRLPEAPRPVDQATVPTYIGSGPPFVDHGTAPPMEMIKGVSITSLATCQRLSPEAVEQIRKALQKP